MTLLSASRLALVSMLLLASAPRSARADMPSGDEALCEMKEGCVSCKQDTETEDGADDSAYFDGCVADAEADGLSESCVDPYGSFTEYFYCPDGVDAHVDAGGCSASSAPVQQGLALALSAVAGVALTVARRRQRANAAA